MSTHPGVTMRPSASSWRRPPSSTRPTAVMMPSSTATSAVIGGPPVPSTTVPPRITMSCIEEVLAGGARKRPELAHHRSPVSRGPQPAQDGQESQVDSLEDDGERRGVAGLHDVGIRPARVHEPLDGSVGVLG